MVKPLVSCFESKLRVEQNRIKEQMRTTNISLSFLFSFPFFGARLLLFLLFVKLLLLYANRDALATLASTSE